MRTQYTVLGIVIISIWAFTLSGCQQGGSSTANGVTISPTSQSATLNWYAPTEKENGDTLASDELAGYQIYYGPVSNPFANVITIESPFVTSYTIEGLENGDYAFSVVAFDNDGRTSIFSNSIIKSFG